MVQSFRKLILNAFFARKLAFLLHSFVWSCSTLCSMPTQLVVLQAVSNVDVRIIAVHVEK